MDLLVSTPIPELSDSLEDLLDFPENLFVLRTVNGLHVCTNVTTKPPDSMTLEALAAFETEKDALEFETLIGFHPALQTRPISVTLDEAREIALAITSAKIQAIAIQKGGLPVKIHWIR